METGELEGRVALITGAAFTACLVVGAVSSVAAPAVAGAVIPGLGLGTVLVITAAVSLASGVLLMRPALNDTARS